MGGSLEFWLTKLGAELWFMSCEMATEGIWLFARSFYSKAFLFLYALISGFSVSEALIELPSYFKTWGCCIRGGYLSTTTSFLTVSFVLEFATPGLGFMFTESILLITLIFDCGCFIFDFDRCLFKSWDEIFYWISWEALWLIRSIIAGFLGDKTSLLGLSLSNMSYFSVSITWFTGTELNLFCKLSEHSYYFRAFWWDTISSLLRDISDCGMLLWLWSLPKDSILDCFSFPFSCAPGDGGTLRLRLFFKFFFLLVFLCDLYVLRLFWLSFLVFCVLPLES
jgi:hypothetical protein